MRTILVAALSLLFIAAPVRAEQIIHTAGVEVFISTCDAIVCIEVVADRFNVANSSRASYAVIDQATGTYLVPPTIVPLQPDSLTVDHRATTATLQIGGVHVTWTSSATFTVAEDIKMTVTDNGIVSRSSWRRLSNEASVIGVIQGIAFDTGSVPLGSITRIARREK